MSAPRTITEKIEWKAVKGPYDCCCGHQHYGRTNLVGGRRALGQMAPQWGWCEEPTCSCRGLRRPDGRLDHLHFDGVA